MATRVADHHDIIGTKGKHRHASARSQDEDGEHLLPTMVKTTELARNLRGIAKRDGVESLDDVEHK